jgi:hypothetical protein
MCAALAIAPSLAGATSHNDKYAGPVDQPRADSYFDPPTVEFTATSQDKKGNKKFRLKLMKKFRFQNISYLCSPPNPPPFDSPRFPSGLGTAEARFKWDLHPFKLKKRKFSTSSSIGPADTSFSEQAIEVAGTIPKSGPASGTFHVSGHIFAEPDYDYPAKDCDSGLVTWTADPK